MADIFISYASPDRESARRLAERLSELGHSVWWDRTIPPGRQFDEVIQEALNTARCVIVLWSAQSVRSNWVKTEAADALAQDKLLPVLMERVLPPMEFKRIQAADLGDWSGEADHAEFGNLVASIERLLKAPRSPTGAVRPSPRVQAPPHAAWRLRNVTIAAAIVLGVAAALVLFPRERGSVDRSASAPTPTSPTDPAWSTSASPPAQGGAVAVSPNAVGAAPATRGKHINLLSAENGGEIVVAPNEDWLSIVDENEDSKAYNNGEGEAVFTFKDGRPATFDTFAVLIPKTNDMNLKEFELLAGNDGPTGHFDPIGTFTTQNIRVIKNPYQEFRFPAVTAKYLKFRFLKSYDPYYPRAVEVYEFRLLGTTE
jgi:hypothetical protein